MAVLVAIETVVLVLLTVVVDRSAAQPRRDPAAAARARRRPRSRRESVAPRRSRCGHAATCRATVGPRSGRRSRRRRSPRRRRDDSRRRRAAPHAARVPVERLPHVPRILGCVRRPATLGLPADVRLVVVTKDAAEESLQHAARSRGARPRGRACRPRRGSTTRCRARRTSRSSTARPAACVGEGTGATWAQVQSLLVHVDRRRARRGSTSAATPKRASTASCSRTASAPAIRACTAPPTSSRGRDVITGALARDVTPHSPRTASASRSARVGKAASCAVTPIDGAETTCAVVHLASFPLPEERGDFGVGVTELMRSGDVFVDAVRVRTRVARHAAVRAAGRPAPHRRPVLVARLQRTLPGQVGCQLFFTDGRPAVLPLRRRRPAASICRRDRRPGQRDARRPGARPVIAAPPKVTFAERVVAT